MSPEDLNPDPDHDVLFMALITLLVFAALIWGLMASGGLG